MALEEDLCRTHPSHQCAGMKASAAATTPGARLSDELAAVLLGTDEVGPKGNERYVTARCLGIHPRRHTDRLTPHSGSGSGPVQGVADALAAVGLNSLAESRRGAVEISDDVLAYHPSPLVWRQSVNMTVGGNLGVELQPGTLASIASQAGSTGLSRRSRLVGVCPRVDRPECGSISRRLLSPICAQPPELQPVRESRRTYPSVGTRADATHRGCARSREHPPRP